MKKIILFYVLLVAMLSTPAFAQQSEEPIDEVISRGVKKATDPAMSAFLAGDFVTAEIEFERNAFCALRATRNFRAGVESARNSALNADIGAEASSSAQSSSGIEGNTIAAPSTSSSAPSANLRTSGVDKNPTTDKRTCADRGFQLYMAGLSQIKLGKLEDAKDSFKRALVLRKDIHDAHFRLALLEYQDGNVKKANKSYKQLKRLESKCKRCEFKDAIIGQVKYLENILG
jgi:tetratricopeptide (TPR) repeat protein